LRRCSDRFDLHFGVARREGISCPLDGRGAFQDPTHASFWYYTRADQNRFIDCPVRFQANRLKNFFPSEWHRDHQIVCVKADLLKVAGRVPGGVAI
jgi:hypothetical protein